MELADTVGRQRVDVAVSVETQIFGAQIGVADVTEQAATGSACELGKKIGLRAHGRGKAQIARRILDDVGPPQSGLNLVDMIRDHAQCLVVVGNRQ